jgi:exonuclease SbcD
MERLRARFPHALVLAFAPAGGSVPSLPTRAPQGRRDHEVALDFVAELRGAPASDAESALLLQACDACADDPEADVLLSGAG